MIRVLPVFAIERMNLRNQWAVEVKEFALCPQAALSPALLLEIIGLSSGYQNSEQQCLTPAGALAPFVLRQL
jgi:hypothetical protein